MARPEVFEDWMDYSFDRNVFEVNRSIFSTCPDELVCLIMDVIRIAGETPGLSVENDFDHDNVVYIRKALTEELKQNRLEYHQGRWDRASEIYQKYLNKEPINTYDQHIDWWLDMEGLEPLDFSDWETHDYIMMYVGNSRD